MAIVTNDGLAEFGIRTIDLEFTGVPEVIAAYLIDTGPSCVLVETGPSTCLSALERGLETSGRSFAEISHIVVTHIHLDHSGAAGVIVKHHPHIRLLVHPVGAPHLIEPERLVNSAGRIYGDDMERLWGEVAGVPKENVTTLADDSRFAIGHRSFKVAHTPGHATHHLVLLDEESGTLFTGDTGGVRVPGTSYVAAPIPPPELNPSAWAASLDRIRSLGPKRLAPTHFGVYDDVETHLVQIPERLRDLVHLGQEASDALQDTEGMTAKIAAYQRRVLGEEAGDGVLLKLALANPDLLGAMGLQRLLRTRAKPSS